MQRSACQHSLFPTEPEASPLGSLRFPAESDQAFRARAIRAATYAKILVEACLANHCVQEYIAAGELGYSVEAIRHAPIVRIEFEQAIAIGGIGETLEATRSKHWGAGPKVAPLEPDDWFFAGRITYVYRENCRYNQRFEQRRKMKRLLGPHRAAVGEARVSPKFIFLEHLSPEREQAIRERLGLSPAEFWQAVNGKLLTRLPRGETQREMF